MKAKALSTMQHIGASLSLEDAVIDLAHRYFCYYRDANEKVYSENKRIVQCLILVCSFLVVIINVGITKNACTGCRCDQVESSRVLPSWFCVIECRHARTFTCELCGLDFTTKRDLEFHSCEKKEQVKRETPKTPQRGVKRPMILRKLLKKEEELFDERELLEKKHRKK